MAVAPNCLEGPFPPVIWHVTYRTRPFPAYPLPLAPKPFVGSGNGFGARVPGHYRGIRHTHRGGGHGR